MARKKRNSAHAAGPAGPAGAASPGALPAIDRENGGPGTVLLLSLMMFLAPALGVPHEEMLQDTLKSIVVSFIALAAAVLFLWEQRTRTEPLRWHAAIWLPVLLMAYALGSMAWSHTFLAGVEAIRWFIFALLMWLGVNTLSRERLPWLALCVHAGAVVASLWAALQFWVDFRFFPQGPNPASTFVNRNFFAEFAVCTLPFAAMLLARARQSATVALLAFSSGFVIVAILMTGTRAALISLWLQLLVLLPYIAWLYRGQFAFGNWPRRTQALAAAVLIGTVGGLGMVPAGNAKIVEEGRGVTALERGFKRTGSISAADPSLGVRMVMWKATSHIIQKRPWLGVGAGAWENEIPRYQAEGSQLETDYYVHNEFLQLLAEYGLTGWLFILALAAYLLAAFARTLLGKSPQGREEGPWRAVLLCSLLSLMVVSTIGFPWRMATTGALFALCLAGLAASDARLGAMGRWSAIRLPWRPSFSQAGLAFGAAALVLAAYITQVAAESEQKIVKATKLALTITASGNPNHPRWDKTKAEMLKLIREGVALNPHYRKITPMVADELARWGDWKNATWIWESVLSSRPYVVAIMANVARGYITTGDFSKAFEYLERAKQLQPTAPSVRSLEVILLSQTGKEPQALALGRQALHDRIYDFDLTNATFHLAWRAGDFQLAAKAMQLRIAGWPESRADGYLQLGNMYANGPKDAVKALAAYRQAVAQSSEGQRQVLLQQIPAAYRAQIEGAPAAAQTSASKG
jgi:O-antigen ligase